MVQRYVLDRIDDPKLRVYVVWGPMLGGETMEEAREAASLLPDPRTAHFWTGAHVLAEALRASAGLEEELAWDTFLLFPPEVGWGNAPPTPAYVMHVGKRLPPDRRLNGEKLAEQVNRLRGSR
ncbi:MAG TPA: hypothetical protein VE078_14625 [Thermoanaerobaculia bacterium]|nr:hypothetical protein [Thermoanaerobaculia bacterium]